MKRILSIGFFLTLVFSTPAFAQTDSSFVLLRSYQGDISDATMDNLSNLYVISTKGQIKKFNAAGDSVAVYNQVRNFGKLFSIDVSNPLKVILFYKDFSTVVVLDRFLTNIATLQLRRYNILQPDAVGLSYDNNIWVYDEYDGKLKKLDEQGNKLSETADFRTVFNQPFAPQKILNDNGLVYLADSTAGVFIFDNYGSFKKKVPVINWHSIAINKSNIISTSSQSISVFNTSTFLQNDKRYPAFTSYLHSFTLSDKFIIFSAKDLKIYRYELR